MLLFHSDPFGGTHELLPCELLGGDLVELFRKNKSKYHCYDFTVYGERYRGSTKEANETRAQRKPPTLREYRDRSDLPQGSEGLAYRLNPAH
jgi:hypothetical protein